MSLQMQLEKARATRDEGISYTRIASAVDIPCSSLWPYCALIQRRCTQAVEFSGCV